MAVNLPSEPVDPLLTLTTCTTLVDISSLEEPQMFAGSAGSSDPSEWTTLPDEMVLAVMDYLDVPSLLAFGAVCRNWRRFIVEPKPWKLAWKANVDAYHDAFADLEAAKEAAGLASSSSAAAATTAAAAATAAAATAATAANPDQEQNQGGNGHQGQGQEGSQSASVEDLGEQFRVTNAGFLTLIVGALRVPCAQAQIEAYAALCKVIPRMYCNVYKARAGEILELAMDAIQSPHERVSLGALDLFSSLALLAANEAAVVDLQGSVAGSAGNSAGAPAPASRISMAKMEALLMGGSLGDAKKYGVFINDTLLPHLFETLMTRELVETGYVVSEVKKAQAAGTEVTDPTIRSLSQILVAFHESIPSAVDKIFEYAHTQMLNKDDWRAREAGLLVFGAITDAMGTGQKPAPLPTGHALYSTLVEVATAALESDPVPVVRDSAAWALTNIFISNAVPLTTSFSTSSIVTPLSAFDELRAALATTVIARVDDPEALVSSNCCGILINMAKSFSDSLDSLVATQEKLFTVLNRAFHDLSVLETHLLEAGMKGRSLPDPGSDDEAAVVAASSDADAADAAEPTAPQDVSFGYTSNIEVPATGPEIKRLAHMRVFDAAAAASALFSLWYEVLESSNANLTDPYYDPEQNVIDVDEQTLEAMVVTATKLVQLLGAASVPAIRMSADTSPVSHRSRFAHVVGRIEFMSSADATGRCRFCGAGHDPPLADVRAFILHALAPAVPLLAQLPAANDLVVDIMSRAADILGEPDINDSVHIAKAEASLVFSFGITMSPASPEVAVALGPLCEDVATHLMGDALLVQCYPVWQQCIQLLGSLSHRTADVLAPHFDEVMDRIIESAMAFIQFARDKASHKGACPLLTADQADPSCACHSTPSVSIGALCLADMMYIVADHLDENNRCDTVFNFARQVLASSPKPTTPIDRIMANPCCDIHAREAAERSARVAKLRAEAMSGPLSEFSAPFIPSDPYLYISNLEAFLFVSRSLVHFSNPEGVPPSQAFIPYARTILEVIEDASPFLCPTKSAAIMAEAAALVGQIATSFPTLAPLAVSDEIFEMLSSLVIHNRTNEIDSMSADFAEETYSVLSVLRDARDSISTAPGGFVNPQSLLDFLQFQFGGLAAGGAHAHAHGGGGGAHAHDDTYDIDYDDDYYDDYYGGGGDGFGFGGGGWGFF